MSSDLEGRLRALERETNARAADDPRNAAQHYEDGIIAAHDLVEASRLAAPPTISRTPLPPPGLRGRIKAGLRW